MEANPLELWDAAVSFVKGKMEVTCGCVRNCHLINITSRIRIVNPIAIRLILIVLIKRNYTKLLARAQIIEAPSLLTHLD